MFPSAAGTTPFSVRDILNLEQQQQPGGLASMELAGLASPSCLLAAFKHEPFAAEAAALPELGEELAPAHPARSPAACYGKTYADMGSAKAGKTGRAGGGSAAGPRGPRAGRAAAWLDCSPCRASSSSARSGTSNSAVVISQ